MDVCTQIQVKLGFKSKEFVYKQGKMLFYTQIVD